MAPFFSHPGQKGGIGIEIDFMPSLGIIGMAFSQMMAMGENTKEPLEKAVKEVMGPSIKTNFDVGGRPPWSPHADTTVARQKTPSRGILIKTGALASAAGQFSDWTIDNLQATLGLAEEVWYGRVHQEGGGNVPQREWALFQPEDVDQIERIFDDWMGQQVDGALWS